MQQKSIIFFLFIKKIKLKDQHCSMLLTQIRIVPSSDPVTHDPLPWTFQRTHVTSPSWPCNVLTKVILAPFVENFLI